MKLIHLCLIICSVLPLTSLATEQRTISVQGKSSVVAVPDAFTVTFKIEQKGETVTKLNSHVRQATQQIIAFLRDMGVADQHIQTMQIQLNPWYEVVQRQQEQKGFILTRTISVSHSQLDQYDKLIDGVLRNGANRIEHFEFVVLDQDRLYLQALEEAMLDAKSKAQQLLKPMQAEIARLISVTEQVGHRPQYAKTMMADAAMSTAMPGTQAIQATVSVIFLIQ